MTVKQRLTNYIKFKKISTRSFCRSIGVSETYVSSMRNSIQPDKLVKITMNYPDLNTGWLLTGEGDMLRTSELLPEIDKQVLIDVSADVFKDKLIEMFKSGEIFPQKIVWEQHRIIIEQNNIIERCQNEITKLKILLAQHGIDVHN